MSQELRRTLAICINSPHYCLSSSSHRGLSGFKTQQGRRYQSSPVHFPEFVLVVPIWVLILLPLNYGNLSILRSGQKQTEIPSQDSCQKHGLAAPPEYLLIISFSLWWGKVWAQVSAPCSLLFDSILRLMKYAPASFEGQMKWNSLLEGDKRQRIRVKT